MAEAIDPRWAWETYQPSDRNPWDLRKAGHLYRRAAFGATIDELHAALKDGPERTIDHLLKGGPGKEEFDAKTAVWMKSTARANNGNQAREWWLYRMLYSHHPLREKLTLFWHNHFATSNSKVNNAGFMLGQYELMRRHALGNFASLLQEMSKDPAMLIWLDTNQSPKNKPNENYARELMELFSLGIGNYTEQDIREAARAFTGWSIDDGKGAFKPEQHDGSDKSFLGKSGKWKGEDIVRICLEQKACPHFIAGKLYRFLVSETVPATPELIEPLAYQLRKSNYDFGALVARVLRSNLFFSPLVYRSRIKSPVDYLLGVVWALEGHVFDANRGGSPRMPVLAESLATLGQNLFYPPSVKGWDGGPTWLNGQTLLFRQNLALAMTSTLDPRFGRSNDPDFLARKRGLQSDSDLVDFFLTVFLQGDVAPEAREKLLHYLAQARKQSVPVYWTERDAAEHRTRSLCHLVLTQPEFQLD